MTFDTLVPTLSQPGQQPGPLTPGGETVSITVLPNGSTTLNGRTVLRVTLYFTLSLPKATDYEGCDFEHWCDPTSILGTTLRNRAWTFDFLDANGNPLATQPALAPPSENLRPNLWDLLFNEAKFKDVKHLDRQGYEKPSWLVSSDSALLEHKFKELRGKHKLWRDLLREKKILSRSKDLPSLARQVNLQQSMDKIQKQITASIDSLDVYLHPNLGDSAPHSLTDLLADRKLAIDTKTILPKLLLPQPALAIIQTRFAAALVLLDSAEAPLSPLGLMGLWVHCIFSLLSDPAAKGTPQTASWDLFAAHAALLAYAKDPNSFKTGMDEDSIGSAQDAIEFLLVSRRKDMGAVQTAPPPDFHQMLGLVQRYPTLLRPLGLAMDLLIDVPAGLTAGNTCSIAANFPQPPAPAPAGPFIALRTHILGGTPATFRARSRFETAKAAVPPPAPAQLPPPPPELLPMDAGYLFMHTLPTENPVLTASSRNMLGEHHKLHNLAFSRRRAVQHKQAPSKNDDIEALPAVDTPGIQLMHVFRQGRTQATRNFQPDPLIPLFADDLVLGFRIDARSDARGALAEWFPLCRRDSVYKSAGLPDWTPSTPGEKLADEGFVTLGGTVEDSMLRLSQTFATWAGDNLAVRQFFMPEDKKKPDAKWTFPVSPTYDFPPKTDLPLRYGRRYTLRVRVVDLAGNSPEFTTKSAPTDKAIELPHKFERHLPYRAPQLLLTRSLDHVRDPGANIATLILRDGHGEPERALVPPHETREHVAFTGALDKGWSKGAFTNYKLTEKGMFPTTDPDEAKCDGMLLRGHPPESCDPFLPDPGAVGAQFYSYDGPIDFENAADERSLTLSFYDEGKAWPDARPLFFRLLPSRTGKAYIERSRNGEAVLCFLPEATDCTLHIASKPITNKPRPQEQQQQQIRSLRPASMHDLYRPPAPPAAPLVAPVGPPAGQPILPAAPKPVAVAPAPDDRDCPPTTLRLIHAVRKPIHDPEVNLSIERPLGQVTADVTGTIKPHLASTAKTIFRAEWTVIVDDPAKAALQTYKYSEAAFSITYPRKSDPNGLDLTVPDLVKADNTSLQHHFQDTRAHRVTYTMESSTCFRGLYPETGTENDHLFSTSKTLPPRVVHASVRPPAPVIDYIIPAFQWIRKRNGNTIESSRQTWLRIWLKRPFPITDNDQALGIVLALNGPAPCKAAAGLVSHIGMNPIYQLKEKGLTNSDMDISMFPQFTLGKAHDGLIAAQTCHLAECLPNPTDPDAKGEVTVLPVPVHFVSERNLWFADVCIQAVQDGFSARAPFVQLALVRYAPNGFTGTSPADDTRISPVVMADDIQLLENRWCSITRTGRQVELTLTGPFSTLVYPPSATFSTSRQRWEYEPILGPQVTEPTPRFSLELEHALHASRPPQWSPVDTAECPVTITQKPNPVDDGIATFTFSLTLPHSTFWRKYRVLLMEEQRLEQTLPNPTPDNQVGPAIYTPRYFEEIEL